jgi:hypothetical protein
MFEIVDNKENSYIVVRYVSSVLPDHDVYIKLNFEGEWGEVSVDYGTSEYDEEHTSEDRLFYVAADYELDEVYVDGDYAILTDQQKEILQKEIESYFKHFIGETFETLYWDYDLEELYLKKSSSRFSLGGAVKLEKIFSKPQRFLNYNGMFLYPPRVENKYPPEEVSEFDNELYLGQPKLNGSSCSVIISEKGFTVRERHNNGFAIPPKIDFSKLHKGTGYMCLVGEYMNKSKKDNSGKAFSGFCIWDITAFNGKILLNSTVEERQTLINKLYPSKQALSYLGVDYLFKTGYQDVYKVNNFYVNFDEIYKKLSKIDMVEGFVLKRKRGTLEMMSREQNNTGWSIKIRKPTANYKF